MNILVLNCGSSSLKYQLINMKNETVLSKGICERIGLEGAFIKHQASNKEDLKKEEKMDSHVDAIQLVMNYLVSKEYGVIDSIDQIHAVGHRAVHGGEYFKNSVIIDENVIKAIEECCFLAPLHNPPNLMGINACKKLMPNITQVAVFDTAFHQTMPEKAFLYAIPYELYEKHKIRRYGFHGTSHKYVSQRAADFVGKDIKNLKIITCHLGNGASICAIDSGKSVDTSMGLTPLEGLIMGTRSGDIDPAIVSFVTERENITTKDFEQILNRKSGILGISGVSSDFRDVEEAALKGNKNAQNALDMFYYRVTKYIGSYAAAMNGVDLIVFTAGLGENSKETRENICQNLQYLGIKIDEKENNFRSKEKIFSTTDSKVTVMVVPTNEELVIARDTRALLDK